MSAVTGKMRGLAAPHIPITTLVIFSIRALCFLYQKTENGSWYLTSILYYKDSREKNKKN